MRPEITVIIPVYNAVRSLELVLTGYCRQSFTDFEVIIADDGSGPEIAALAGAFGGQSPFPIRCVRHDRMGYRKTVILNEAIRATSTPYLIFADEDCIPHRDFVGAHHAARESRTVLCGRRVNLTEAASQKLTPGEICGGSLEQLSLHGFTAFLLGRNHHWDEGIVINNPTLHRWINRKAPSLLGCNFSVEKAVLEEINGFNEDFSGYAGEDTDLEYRLRLAGVGFRWVRHRAIQYHLFHPARTRSRTNIEALERTRAEGRPYCRNGLRKFR